MKRNDIKKETLQLVLDFQKMSKDADKTKYDIYNIKRLKKRSIAELAEDRFAKYLYDVINNKDFYYYINPNVDGMRPDIMIVNSKQEIIALIEIKINLGFCRNIFQVDEKKKNKRDYQIDNRVNKFCSIKDKTIIFNDGVEDKQLRFSKNCKIYYVSTSLENYIKDRDMIDDYKAYVSKNSNYKNFLKFYVIVNRYHKYKDGGLIRYVSKDEISLSIDDLFNSDFGMNSMINEIVTHSNN